MRPDNWEPDHATAFVLNAAMIVLVAPFVEELFFRGIGVRALTVFGTMAAILLSGIVFGAVHGILGALPAAGALRYRPRLDPRPLRQHLAGIHRPRGLQRHRQSPSSSSAGSSSP